MVTACLKRGLGSSNRPKGAHPRFFALERVSPGRLGALRTHPGGATRTVRKKGHWGQNPNLGGGLLNPGGCASQTQFFCRVGAVFGRIEVQNHPQTGLKTRDSSIESTEIEVEPPPPPVAAARVVGPPCLKRKTNCGCS